MNKKLSLAILAILTSIGIHAYLTTTYYPLKFGLGGAPAICNINDLFNCDAVTASKYSTFAGIPLAVWGMSANGLLLIMLVGFVLHLSTQRERLLRYSFWLATGVAITSIVTGLVSALFIGVYCPFCIVLYVLSFITFELIRRSLDESPFLTLKADISSLFKDSKLVLVGLIAVPAVAFAINKNYLKRYNLENFSAYINSAVQEWKINKKVTLDASPSLVKGPARSDAKMVVSEFADFLCSHCRNAAPTLEAFSRTHPNVRFEFFNFPLDGACNPAFDRPSGFSCRLAKSVHCAGKQDLGWELHDIIFQNQASFFRMGSVDDINNKVKELANNLQLNWDDLKACVEDPQTQSEIAAQAKSGTDANVRGTPTVFVNEAQLPFIPALEQIYESITAP